MKQASPRSSRSNAAGEWLPLVLKLACDEALVGEYVISRFLVVTLYCGELLSLSFSRSLLCANICGSYEGRLEGLCRSAVGMNLNEDWVLFIQELKIACGFRCCRLFGGAHIPCSGGIVKEMSILFLPVLCQ